MKYCRQSGGSTVAAVMVLLTIGVLMMTALDRQLSAQLRIDNKERDYLKAYNQAASSLNWGAQLAWLQPQEEWYCQNNQALQLEACIKMLANSDSVLLKGTGRMGGDKDSDRRGVVLYQLMSLRRRTSDDSPDGYFNLVRLASGWLDFCPASEC